MTKDASADGLRGVAAANVVLCHLLITLFPLGFQYLWPGAASASTQAGIAEQIISAPILSILWNGNFPVCVFFVLSGYVLSARFSVDGDASALTTMAMRRYIRLGVPILGSVLFAFLAMKLDIDAKARAAAMTENAWLAHFWHFDPTVSGALKEGIYGAIFRGGSPYVPVLWTMRIELLGSLLVFGYAVLAPRGRLAPVFFSLVVLAIASIAPTDWPLYAAFLIGVHIGRVATAPRLLVIGAVIGTIIFGAFDNSSLYAWTTSISDDPVWRKHFFNVLGGACAVYAVRCGVAASFLKSAPVQFLGRISYSLYLVHFPLVLTLLCVVFVSLLDAGWSRGAAAAVAMGSTALASIAVATVFQRSFDTWGIRLSHRLFPGRRQLPEPNCGSVATAEEREIRSA